MIRVRWTFARGGAVEADLHDHRAPKTVAAFAALLPCTAPMLHARYSGREIGSHLVLPGKPPRENQSIRVSAGDVIFFREWEEQFDFTGHEGVGFFYGPEITRDTRGDVAVNVIGRLLPGHLDLAAEIGVLVWQQGIENATIERLNI